MCFNHFLLLKHDHDLVSGAYTADKAGKADVVDFRRLAHHYVLICLHLKHSDLPARVRYQERIPLNIEPYIHWVVRLVLVLQVDQSQESVLL